MYRLKFNKFIFLFIVAFSTCIAAHSQDLKVGAECTEDYIPYLQGKAVAVVANQTSFIKQTHLVDSLLACGVNVKKIFAPEHGFRGTADAGEKIDNNIDKRTGLPVISLYGKNNKPGKEALQNIDIVVFDIQDVGVRFYTYISTMHYVMEACAEQHVEFMVLDRPNPNGFYVDGPVLEDEYKSFVGIHPVPLVHGMTIAEYAQMINGEKWLKNSIQCKLKIILCDGYDHTTKYELPIKPSPNLPNMRAIYHYPTLGLFEGTVVSCGRGTDYPFQMIGHPKFNDTTFSFVPRSIEGASKYPRYKGETCYGVDLRNDSTLQFKAGQFNIHIVKYMYEHSSNKSEFFNSFFLNLSGTKRLKALLLQDNISPDNYFWKDAVAAFMKVREKYLLYGDF